MEFKCQRKIGARRRWLSTGEAAEDLGITPRTLYRLIDTGRLAAYRLGRVIRIESDDLQAYLQSTRIHPGSLSHLYGGAPATAALTRRARGGLLPDRARARRPAQPETPSPAMQDPRASSPRGTSGGAGDAA